MPTTDAALVVMGAVSRSGLKRIFESRIRELARRFERFSSHILNCVVVIQQPHQSSRKGDLFDVHINVTVPGSLIVVDRALRPEPT